MVFFSGDHVFVQVLRQEIYDREKEESLRMSLLVKGEE